MKTGEYKLVLVRTVNGMGIDASVLHFFFFCIELEMFHIQSKNSLLRNGWYWYNIDSSDLINQVLIRKILEIFNAYYILTVHQCSIFLQNYEYLF